MSTIVEMDGFEPKKINLDNLYLDPNNPRFEDKKKEFPEDKIVDDQPQNFAKDQLSKIGDISELTSSIKASGFISVDRLVVKEIESHPGCYVVLEGNRRTFACKTLMEDYETGGDLELENIIHTLKKIDCLIYTGSYETSKITSKIQGLRHITRTKDWSAYSQAKHIDNLIKEEDMTGKEVSELIGLTPTKVAQSQRSLHVFEQAIKENKGDYPQITKKKNFSIFIETVGKDKNWQNYIDFDPVKQQAKAKDKLSLLVEGTMPIGDSEPRVKGAAIDLRVLGKALRMDRASLVDDVLSGDTTVDDVRRQVADPSAIGIGPILSKCHETLEALGNINMKHMTTDAGRITEMLTLLDDSIKEVKKRVKA